MQPNMKTMMGIAVTLAILVSPPGVYAFAQSSSGSSGNMMQSGQTGMMGGGAMMDRGSANGMNNQGNMMNMMRQMSQMMGNCNRMMERMAQNHGAAMPKDDNHSDTQ